MPPYTSASISIAAPLLHKCWLELDPFIFSFTSFERKKEDTYVAFPKCSLVGSNTFSANFFILISWGVFGVFFIPYLSAVLLLVASRYEICLEILSILFQTYEIKNQIPKFLYAHYI